LAGRQGGFVLILRSRLRQPAWEGQWRAWGGADQPLHVIQRGNNRQAIFFEDQDYGLDHEWLAYAAREHGCAIPAYVLMTNHVHFLVTPRATESLPRMMQSLGRRYVRMINMRYRRTGTLWEGRYKGLRWTATLISLPAAGILN
jgi:REP element-mobilizing transposase RayT